MKILVTGGAGYIGSELVKALSENGHEVSVFSRRTGGDITNYDSVRQAVKGKDAVFHLAALNNQLAPYSKLFRPNVFGTENVMKASIGGGVGKVIYASTAAFSVSKITSYGISKQQAEEVVKMYWDKIDAPVLRYPMVYDEPNIRKLMLFGNFPMTTKNNTWHLCYRKSLVSAYISALETGKSEIYTIADKTPVTSHELYETLMEAQGYKPFYVPHPVLVPLIFFSYICPPLHRLFDNIFQDRAFEPTKKLKYGQVDTLETFDKLVKSTTPRHK